ncbi:MAG TPA: FAD-dependent oxidoreductase [Nitrospira sp.]|nr:FAD-dependent oxidoreductase [Nitrospira sp.]
MTPPSARSVLVLGAGPAGLTAAYRLARQGLRVTLIDHAAAPGGQLVDEPRLPPLILGCHRATTSLLKSLDRKERGWKDLALEFRLSDDRFVRYPRSRFPNPLHIVFTLGRFGGLSRSERWRLLSWLEAIWEGSLELATDLEHRTAQEWLASIGQGEQARRSVWNPLAHWLTGNELADLSADALIRAVKPFLLQRPSDNRIASPGNTWEETLVKPLRDRLTHEIALALRTPALHLLHDRDRVAGVRVADGSVLQADWYISALPPGRTTAILPERWLSRYAYFQQIVELKTKPCRFVEVLVPQRLEAPRLVLFASGPFYWAVVGEGDRADTRAVLMTRAALTKSEPVRQQVNELLRSLGLLAPAVHQLALGIGETPHAVLSLAPGTKAKRPIQQSPITNLLLAGAWTDTGWPANVESAILSGERCAALVTGQGSDSY